MHSIWILVRSLPTVTFIIRFSTVDMPIEKGLFIFG
jgi:hypothetical protein